jgi:hypothetical protein
MNSYKRLFILLFILMFPAFAFASGKANLDLWKRDPFLYGSCGHCAELLSFTENKDRADFSSYGYQYSSGYYTINLKGAKGTAVTLFGMEDFRTTRGYLIVVKEDDKDIEITDLEAFPPSTWTTVDSEAGGKYSAYYLPHQDFKALIASIKWGKGPQSASST